MYLEAQEKDNKIPGNRWIILSWIGNDVSFILAPANELPIGIRLKHVAL